MPIDDNIITVRTPQKWGPRETKITPIVPQNSGPHTDQSKSKRVTPGPHSDAIFYSKYHNISMLYLIMTNKIKLLLHAEDGSFPYLSDNLLATYFNPEDDLVKNHLTIGIAVKDTCVVPLYKKTGADTNVKKLKRKRSTKEEHNGTETHMIQQNKVTKPSGYTFDAKPIHELTHLFSGYDTMVVPTFDLLDDSWVAMDKELVARHKKQKITKEEDDDDDNGEDKKRENSKVFPNVSSTKDKSSLITPNGVQQITPCMYAEVGMKLQCNSMLSLFDQAHPDDGKKRKIAAVERTQEWLEKCLSSIKLKGDGRHKYLWGAFSCVGGERLIADGSFTDLTQHDNVLLLKGIALVGWHHIPRRHDRIKIVNKVRKKVAAPGTQLCILAALTLEQIVEAASSGVGTIGTSLPVVWARSHKAMVSGLDVYQQYQSKGRLDSHGYMDLSNEKYRDDESPMLPNCLCLACKNGRHSKAYIHHLIKANELLAQIFALWSQFESNALLVSVFVQRRGEGGAVVAATST
jgi:tRNA-guanine transglycosylases, various specificities